MKKSLIIILLVMALIVIGVIYYWYQKETCPSLKENCLKRIIYDSNKEAYRWSELSSDYFKTKEEALENCFIINKDLLCD